MKAPCQSCGVEVAQCVAIVALAAGAGTQHVLADLKPMLPEPGLLLHVGESYEDGRWVVAPLGTRSGTVLARQIPLPHAHRPHVCDAVPPAWLAETTQAVPA